MAPTPEQIFMSQKKKDEEKERKEKEIKEKGVIVGLER